MKILSNGSKWLGEGPDPLSTLLDLLKVEPLDPRFYPFASTLVTDDGRGVLFFGNFYRVSHVFSIEFDTSGGPEYTALLDAVADNMRTRGYLDACFDLAPCVTHGRDWRGRPVGATDGGAS